MKEEEAAFLLKEILSGYSKIEVCGQTAYLKHYSDYEKSIIKEVNDNIIKQCQAIGLNKEADAVREAIESGSWSDGEEKKYKSLQITIENLTKTKEKMILPSQKENQQKLIDKEKKNLDRIIFDRKESIGRVAEDFANIKGYEAFLLSLVYKDKNLKTPFFEEEELEEIEQEDLEKLFVQFRKIQEYFSDHNISTLIVSSFFSQYLNLGEDCHKFFDSPILYLSNFQVRFLSLIKTFISIFRNYRIPEGISNDYERVLSFVKNENNKNSKETYKGKTNNKEASMVSYVGATAQDIETLEPETQKIDLIEMMKANGGKLSMMQLAAIQGNS